MIVVPTAASLYLCWTLYLAIMALKRARDSGTLPKVAYYLGLPLLWLGLLVDFICNVLVTLLPFLDLPREFLVTARLQRYVDGPDGWRKRLALWFALNLLDPFDPKGYHIKK